MLLGGKVDLREAFAKKSRLQGIGLQVYRGCISLSDAAPDLFSWTKPDQESPVKSSSYMLPSTVTVEVAVSVTV